MIFIFEKTFSWHRHVFRIDIFYTAGENIGSYMEFQKKIISNTNFKDRENLKLNIDSNNKFEDLVKNLSGLLSEL